MDINYKFEPLSLVEIWEQYGTALIVAAIFMFVILLLFTEWNVRS